MKHQMVKSRTSQEFFFKKAFAAKPPNVGRKFYHVSFIRNFQPGIGATVSEMVYGKKVWNVK